MKRFLLTTSLILSSMTMLTAQPGNPGGDPWVPVTGGILYLILAGLGYGAYHIKKKIKGE